MAINIFAGARRLALLITGLAVVGTTILLVLFEPHVSVSYGILSPDGIFLRSHKSCSGDSTEHHFIKNTSLGQEVSINLCILAMPFGEDNELLIPYRIDEEGNIWGSASYSLEVHEYKRELESRFVIPPADEKEIRDEISARYRENFIEGLGYLLIGLVAFGVFVWGTGWIVRGFLGIPQGKDKGLK